jgi:glycosyltransferase involved in cell wall biosynthesis
VKISYVIPVYNCAAFLQETIDSILKQTYKDNEIIVIDDASTDDLFYLKAYYGDDNDGDMGKITWITNEERKGSAYCRNIGNGIAKGDYIAVCDGGDICRENRSQVIVDYFKVNPDIDIMYTDVRVVNALGQVLFEQKATEWNGASKPPISHPTVAYKRHIILKDWYPFWKKPHIKYKKDYVKYHEGCLDTDFYEFFMIDCFRMGYKFGFTNEVTYFKMDMTGSYHHRDVLNAKQKKYEKYKKYEIDIKKENV